MERLFLDIQQPLTLDSCRELRHLVEQIMKPSIKCPTLQNKILLCLAEASSNLVKHAASSTSMMRVRFGSSRNNWWMELLDDGEPWDSSIEPEVDSIEAFIENESGRGISLLHHQCDELQYTAAKNTHMNCLRMIWTIPEQNNRQKILIVEDDAVLRKLFTAYMEDHFEVIIAASGKEAISKLNNNNIELVLSDISMPEMDGVSLREKLLEHENHRLIPFVFVTALTDILLKEKVTTLGIDDFVNKPVNKAALLQVVKRVLTRAKQFNQQLSERLNKKITSSLTPNLPEQSHGWRLALSCRDTGVGGGDIIVHHSTESNFQLVLSDVMGHDDNSKFFAHACGGYLHGLMQTMNSNIKAGEILEYYSDFAHQDKLLSQITLTCCSIILAPEGQVNIACAGHPEPLHIMPGGIKRIPVGGILPGLMTNASYQSKFLELSNDERIAIYTDGLFESAVDNESREELEKQIINKLADTIDLPIKDSITEVMALFDKLGGTPPLDDALLILLEPHIQ